MPSHSSDSSSAEPSRRARIATALAGVALLLGVLACVWTWWGAKGRYQYMAYRLVSDQGLSKEHKYMRRDPNVREKHYRDREEGLLVKQLHEDPELAARVVSVLWESSDPAYRAGAWNLVGSGVLPFEGHLETFAEASRRDPAPEVRIAALDALVAWGEDPGPDGTQPNVEPAFAILCRSPLLVDPEWQVRRAAMPSWRWMFGDMAKTEQRLNLFWGGVARILRACPDRNVKEFLMEIPEARWNPSLLIPFLDDEDPKFREYARSAVVRTMKGYGVLDKDVPTDSPKLLEQVQAKIPALEEELRKRNIAVASDFDVADVSSATTSSN